MFIPADINNKTIGVLGLSRSGLASLDALVAAGAQVYAYDDHAEPPMPNGAVYTHYEQWPWDDMALMVISPGIPHNHPAPHPAATAARAHGVALISDIELMLMAKPAAKIIGITGTNGKSTIVSLIDHILKFNAIASVLGGNIGTSVLTLDDPGAHGVITLELSSYQLEITPSLALDTGGIINITPDHLDRHGGWDGYVAAKARLAAAIKPNGTLVLGDDPATAIFADHTQASVVFAHKEDAPDLADLPDLAGPHNAMNTALAIAICAEIGLEHSAIVKALPSFKGLPHRMEEVARHQGIRFVNDSKATNGEAAAEALKSYDDIYWIAGGTAKDDGLGPALAVMDTVKKAYLIGASAETFAKQISTQCPHEVLGTMERALRQAYIDAAAAPRAAKDFATILLSPAAASFDQFENFEHRGDVFSALTQELITAATEMRHV